MQSLPPLPLHSEKLLLSNGCQSLAVWVVLFLKRILLSRMSKNGEAFLHAQDNLNKKYNCKVVG